MKLLLIDDDVVDRMDAIRMLKNSGKNIYISEASNAETGLKMARESDYDLILLDFQLPGMNGLEVLSFLNKKTDKATAVVMLSHSEDDELAKQCIQHGAQDYVKKSEVTTSRLMRAIEHARVRYNIHNQLKSSKEQLRVLAETDVLTGLLNRYSFQINLKSAMNSAKRHGGTMAMLMLDLDKFKHINDTLGHDVGDELLIAVGKRLESVVRVDEVLSRLAGDEFAILVQQLNQPAQARVLAQRIQQEFQQPFVLSAKAYNITMSIGIAVYPDCADTPEQLMKCADVAMYRSKKAGRNQISFYSKAVHQKVLKRVELENSLFRAWQRSEFELHFQPMVSSKDNRLVAIESLIRWQHPTCGLTMPEEFLNIAEEVGLMHHIGFWVLDSACAQWHQWFGSDHNAPGMSVNISAQQLADPLFLEQLKQIAKRYHMPVNKLTLEISERDLDCEALSGDILKHVAGSGFGLSLDDFGTGQASLAVLHQNPFDTIKISPEFVSAKSQHQDATFVKALVNFAQQMGLATVAEAVETQQQYQASQSFGVDLIQGYHVEKPLSAAEFQSRWLKKYQQ